MLERNGESREALAMVYSQTHISSIYHSVMELHTHYKIKYTRGAEPPARVIFSA